MPQFSEPVWAENPAKLPRLSAPTFIETVSISEVEDLQAKSSAYFIPMLFYIVNNGFKCIYNDRVRLWNDNVKSLKQIKHLHEILGTEGKFNDDDYMAQFCERTEPYNTRYTSSTSPSSLSSSSDDVDITSLQASVDRLMRYVMPGHLQVQVCHPEHYELTLTINSENLVHIDLTGQQWQQILAQVKDLPRPAACDPPSMPYKDALSMLGKLSVVGDEGSFIGFSQMLSAHKYCFQFEVNIGVIRKVAEQFKRGVNKEILQKINLMHFIFLLATQQTLNKQKQYESDLPLFEDRLQFLHQKQKELESKKINQYIQLTLSQVRGPELAIMPQYLDVISGPADAIDSVSRSSPSNVLTQCCQQTLFSDTAYPARHEVEKAEQQLNELYKQNEGLDQQLHQQQIKKEQLNDNKIEAVEALMQSQADFNYGGVDISQVDDAVDSHREADITHLDSYLQNVNQQCQQLSEYERHLQAAVARMNQEIKSRSQSCDTADNDSPSPSQCG